MGKSQDISALAAASAAPPAFRLSRYQWLTLISAFLGWMFDSMDLNLFTLVLVPSVGQLLHSTDATEISKIGSFIIAGKLLTWGVGGVLFGVAADRLGRSRVMAWTIFIYAVFTLLSAFAHTWTQLAVAQAMAGFGIGGEWAAGAALVAESWPERHRARAMQIMQMAFAFGFLAAALDNLLLGGFGWRWVLGVGAAPALVTILVRRFVPEPQRWVKVRDSVDAAPAMQTFAAIFAPALRRKTIVGVVVASAAMLGCWGGLTFLPSWIHQLSVAAADHRDVGSTVSYAFILMMIGATLGYLTLIWMLDALGRRMSYFIFSVGSLAVSLVLFMTVHDIRGVLWLMPVYGYFVIGAFGTFASYLPELFPTRVRATGQGFCWNMARALTSIGPIAGNLVVAKFGSFPAASAAVSLLFIVGMVSIWLGPETKGVPLDD
ncbi:MFS transporter [Paraburkholderia solisilvae]|uniref:Niacin/nicotinamide transporter NaiP n=1 Tax=Paraburkholderia solisilvae TaxID=624376 RepID=A0A6J5D3K8_9BURK|nr:MFS transporter [Paraburkholderia solisilvae]CAB3747987.1 Putative niacin/nicotinamide transporter NaiP [Paraburkholderia solisilvae]